VIGSTSFAPEGELAEPGEQRRLAAILVADMFGYSRLMETDERGTIARQKVHRAELIDPKITEHHGRIVKTTGDGMLVEFASVVDAVECAVAIQRAMLEREAEVPNDRRIRYRVGINLGDIVVEGDDIFGDGVNIAARLEEMAEPGGLRISGTAYDQLKQKVNAGYEDLGEVRVKNIEEPVRVYRVMLGPEAVGRVIGEKRPSSTPRPLGRIAAVVAISVLVAGGALWWFKPWAPEFEPASLERMAYPLPDDPSIAVLPFDNFSDDPRLDFFVSGLTEDLTTALSKVRGLFVIARNSAASYKGKSFKIKQVAEELGVQYVLEGSVQKEGERLRITAQLVDALSGRHLWADRFDRQASDIFALQDEIVLRVLSELRVNLTEGDRARAFSGDTNNLESWLLGAEGYREFLKFTRKGNIRARELWQAAQEADPNRSVPLAGMAFTHWYEARRGWSADREASIRLGTELAERAIENGPTLPLGYQALGSLYLMRGDVEQGIALRRKAVELAPNDFSAVGGLAARLINIGQEQEAVELFERALRLSPNPPSWMLFSYGLGLHLVGRKEDAAEWLKKAIGKSPKRADIHARLAAVYVDLGRMGEAKAAAAEALRLKPSFSVSAHQKVFQLQDPERNAWLKDLLLRASLPE
jgi:TolB-like protein/class 3 adenylate cyclase